MSGSTSIHCGNCGTTLEEPPRGVTGVCCPVCQLFNDLTETPAALAVSVDSLEVSLGSLLTQARAGGLSDEEIVRVLRDELEFAAELASSGRHMYVQIIDLGPMEIHAAPHPLRERTSALRGRAVGC